ncbi:SH3 domain [Trinorchestia longiramus]|nr:SH3 domain [Trinorchestia longiramus]
MSGVQVRVLYDFDAQPDSGEMSLKEGEILTVTRQNVGDGWWEGMNALGEAGLFPAAYTEEISSAPPSMPPPSLPPEYKAAGTTALPWDAWEAGTSGQGAAPLQPQPQPQQNVGFKSQQNYDADDWDEDWDDDDSESGVGGEGSLGGSGSMALRGHPGAAVVASDAGSIAGKDGRGSVKKGFNRFSALAKSGVEDYLLAFALAPELHATFLHPGSHVVVFEYDKICIVPTCLSATVCARP